MTIIGRMRFACWITKATNTESGILSAFHGINGYANAPKAYVYTYIASLVCSYENLRIHRMAINATHSLLNRHHAIPFKELPFH